MQYKCNRNTKDEEEGPHDASGWWQLRKPKTKQRAGADWCLVVQIQYKYKTNTIQIQNKYNTNTKRIQNKYKTITIQIQ